MNRLLVILGAAAMGLSGCGPAEGPGEPEGTASANLVNAVTGGNDTATALELSDSQLRLTFARALADAEIACDGVVNAVRLPDQNGVPAWRAECKNGTAHAMSIMPNGTVNIVSRPTRR